MQTSRKFSLAVLFLFIVTACLMAMGQGSRMRSETAPIEDADQDNPQARDQWFLKGRTAPPGYSPADLRYRAHQRKMQLRALRAQKAMLAGAAAAAPSAGWTSLGPAPMTSDAGNGQDYGLVTGRVNAVAIDPADPTGNTVYVGGAVSGLWRSQNAASGAFGNATGVTWTSLTDNQPSLSFGAIALQPGNTNSSTRLSNVILAGTGETNSAIDSYYGLGFLRSGDGGNTWTLISSANNGQISLRGRGVSHIAFSTAQTSRVVAAVGTAPVGNIEGLATDPNNLGLYYSTDAGVTWTRATPADSGTLISSTSATAIVWNAAAGKFFAAIRYHGFYSSPDGVTWTRLASQPGGSVLSPTACPADHFNATTLCPMFRAEMAVVPGRNEMYAWYIDINITNRGIWRTLDGGGTWTRIDETGFISCGEANGCGASQAFFNMSLAAVPSGTVTDLYLGAVNEFKCRNLSSATATCNGGAGWMNLTHVYGCLDIAHVHPDEHGIDFMIAGGKAILYFGNDGGVYRALDGFSGLATGTCGGTNQFDSLNAGLGSMSQFVSFSQHPSNTSILLGGTQDNGSPSRNTSTSGTNWINVNAGDGGYNEINPANPNEWFTANTEVSIQRCTLGTSCNLTGFSDVVTALQVGGDVGAFYTPYILDPQSAASELIVGTCRVWRGTGGGSGFSALSQNFDTGSSATCTRSETNFVRGLAAGGPTDTSGFSKVIYATTEGTGPTGFAGGRVFGTTNAGVQQLADITSNLNNSSHYTISGVAIDTSDATGQTAYATVMGFGTPHVWKTTNAGASWTDFSGSLPDAPANTIVVDAGSATVYVGTDVGVFGSPTSAANWTEVGPITGAGFLPSVPVTKLRILNSGAQKLLRASTYGRGIWEFALIAGPDYQIAVSNTPQTIFAAQTATFNGTLTSFNGYNSAVALSCAMGITNPPGSCVSSPGTVTPASGGASFSLAAGGAAGDYLFNIHGIGSDASTITHDASVTLHIIDFALTAPSPATVTANRPTASNATTFQVTASGSFNQAVSLACSGLPAGAACNFSPSASVSPTAGNPITVSLTISTTASTPTGSSTITISANTSGAPAPRTRSLTFTVTALADYVLDVPNKAQSAAVTATGTFSGTLTAINSYSTAVNLSCSSGQPAAPGNCTFTPGASIVPTAGGAAFTVTVSSQTTQAYAFDITGNGAGALNVSQSAPVTFTATSDFTLPATSGSATVLAGSTAQYTLNFAPAGSDPTFLNAVTYSCSASGFPNLSRCIFSPTQIAAGSPASAGTVTLSIATTAPRASLVRRSWFYALWMFLPGLVLALPAASAEGRRRRRVLSIACGLILLTILVQAACGGGTGGGTTPPPPQPGTTAGTYTITIDATETSGATTARHSTTVALTVQ
jgi:large repetitive protein